MEQTYQGIKLAERGARLSIAAYLVLSVFKLLVGYFANSEALTADGLNNTTDILSSVAVLIGLRIARKPADDNHPYGHFRAETVASLIASIIMIGVGVSVIYQGFQSVFMDESVAPNNLSSIVGIVSGLALYLLYRYNKKIAIQVKSSGLMAAAKDNLSDVWVSLATTFGIIGSQFGLPWLDPLLAVVVGALIIKTGYDIFADASHDLTDGFNKEELGVINDLIYKVDGVVCVKDIKARRHGKNVLVDLTIGVNPLLNIAEGHQITECVEDVMKEHYEVLEISVHVEPEAVI